jgi:hypothetical protein
VSYTNFLKFQNFVGHCLCSYNALDRVNIITRERLLVAAAEDERTADGNLAAEVLAYITPREGGDGRIGAGIIVEKPGFEVIAPNLPGPEGDLTLEILVLEDRITNLGPTEGTQIAADQICQIIMDALHWQQFEGFGQMFCDRNAMVEARDFQPLIAYRLRFRLRMPRGQTTKVAQPTISETENQITLACATPDAQIYYTLDESYPGRSNPGALLYEAPFAVVAGDIINAAAYLEGQTPSHMIQATVT